jgi:hypothetical protein
MTDELAAMNKAIDGCLERGCIRADTMLEELKAQGLVVVQGWQDIASAPRDGTLILLYQPDGLMACRRWQENHWRGWDFEDATHWMPLPAAPIAAAGDTP